MSLVDKKVRFAKNLAKYCTNTYVDDDAIKGDTISMILPITADISILFWLTNSGVISSFHYKGYRNPSVTIPVIQYNKRFNLYKFISHCLQLTEKHAETNLHTDSRLGVPYIGLALAHWLKAYEEGYSFSNFKKAVYQNMNCAYSYTLSYSIEPKEKTYEVVLNNVCITYEGDRRYANIYLNFPNDVLTGGANIQLEQEFFYRRYDLDALLTNFVPTVPEVVSYFRNKNIAKILNNL